MITRQLVDEFFQDNERRGLSLDRDMLWGYFFTHREPAPLERIRPIVEALGYRYVDIFEPSEDDDEREYVLHVERVEQHSAASLFERCEALANLARDHGLDSYDGFDVGNVDGSGLYPDQD